MKSDKKQDQLETDCPGNRLEPVLTRMDHSVKAMSPHRKVAFSRLLNRHRFENDELEALFQRYMFKVRKMLICLELLSYCCSHRNLLSLAH